MYSLTKYTEFAMFAVTCICLFAEIRLSYLDVDIPFLHNPGI